MLKSVRFRIILLGAILIALIGILSVYETNKFLYANLMEDRKEKAQELVETASSLIQKYYSQAKAGKISEAEAKEKAKESVAALRYGKGGYFWINDLNYRMLMHPIKPSLVGKDLSNLKDSTGKYFFREFVKVCREHGEGFVSYMWPKPGSDVPVPKLSYVKLFKPWGWIVGTGFYIDDIETILAQSRNRVILISTIVIAILILGFYFFLKFFLSKPLNTLLQTVDHLSKTKDLSHQITATGGEEFEKIAKEFNSMIDSFARTVREIKAQADKASGIAQGLAAAVEETSASSNQVSQAIDEIRKEIEGIAASIEELNAGIEEVASGAQTVADQASGVAEQAEEMRKAAAQGKKAMLKVVDAINSVASGAEKTTNVMKDLEGASSEIGEIINTITNIAEQTNLLALNAAIEAARAGEAGRGFAVVADEVRKLAEETASAAKKIGDIIGRIQNMTKLAADTVKEAQESVKAGVSIVKTVEVEIEKIANAVEETSHRIKDISSAIETQSASTEEMAAGVDTLAKSIARVNEMVREIDENIKDQTKAIEEVANTAEELAAIAAKLQEAVSTFKLSEAGKITEIAEV